MDFIDSRIASILDDSFWNSALEQRLINAHKSDGKSGKKAPAKGSGKPQVTEYRFESRASWNGKDYVEEDQERYHGVDGEVHSRSRCRLGDRWHDLEDHTGPDGKSLKRETWHNVKNDQIQAFKNEWAQKQQQPAGGGKPQLPAGGKKK
jgi:hypothetical protein